MTRYKSPAALQMAIKSAAAASPMDTNAAIAAFYRHRLLCRVFLGAPRGFILKRGQGMLARVIDARATRDIDLLSESADLDAALAELKRCSAIDLGDFVAFDFLGARPIKKSDEYRDGLNASFNAFMGGKLACKVNVDLVVDQTFDGEADMLEPADRLDIEGLTVCDYPVYPVVNTVADKVCAMVEQHDGRPLSRVKDLIDILVVSGSANVKADSLRRQLLKEMRLRHLPVMTELHIPEQWRVDYERNYSKLAKAVGINALAPDLGAAEVAAKAFIDPVLDGLASGLEWIATKRKWDRVS